VVARELRQFLGILPRAARGLGADGMSVKRDIQNRSAARE
jgi:hypothetical protein